MCILSGNYVRAKLVEMKAVGLGGFSASLGSEALFTTPPQWLVGLLWNSMEC